MPVSGRFSPEAALQARRQQTDLPDRSDDVRSSGQTGSFGVERRTEALRLLTPCGHRSIAPAVFIF
jgi:hypothetical protein